MILLDNLIQSLVVIQYKLNLQRNYKFLLRLPVCIYYIVIEFVKPKTLSLIDTQKLNGCNYTTKC